MTDRPLTGRPFSTQTYVSATFILIFTTLLSKALGLLRDVLVARYFGASMQVDAFMVALTLPMLVWGMGFAFSTGFIPAYQRILVREGRLHAGRLAGGAVGLTLVLSSFLVAIIILIPHQLIWLVAPGLPPQTATLAAHLARQLSLLVLGLNLFYILGAIYNAQEHFKIPALTDLASNVLVLLTLILLSPMMGIGALALGMVVGSLAVVFGMAIPIVVRRLISFDVNLWNDNLRKLIVLSAPIFLIEVLSQGVTIIENFFGARLGPGSISALGYAKRPMVMVILFLTTTVARAVFPAFSRLATERNLDGARNLLVQLTRQCLVACVPLSIALMYFRDEIISLVFMRGAFDAEAMAKTSAAFLYYAAGLSIAAIALIFTRACYALSDTITPLKAAVLGLMVMGGLNALLVPVFGVKGIALSTSLSLVPSLTLVGAMLIRRLRGIELATLLRTGARATVCGAVSLGPVIALQGRFGLLGEGIVGLATGLTLYCTAYFSLGWFVMQQEMHALWAMFQRWRRDSGVLNRYGS